MIIKRLIFEKEIKVLKKKLLIFLKKIQDGHLAWYEFVLTKNKNELLIFLNKKDGLYEEIISFDKRLIWEITKQQLLARDLKKMFLYLLISFHAKRILDYAIKISLFFIELKDNEIFNFFVQEIKHLFKYPLKMMKEITGFIEKPNFKVQEIKRIEEDLNKNFFKIIKKLLIFFLKKNNLTEDISIISLINCLQKLKYLERWGDHLFEIWINLIDFYKITK